MNYRIKNIETWRQLNPKVAGWMNDEVHHLSGELEEQAIGFNVADPTTDKAMGQEEDVIELPANMPRKLIEEEVACDVCGKICRNKKGLKVHKRFHK